MDAENTAAAAPEETPATPETPEAPAPTEAANTDAEPAPAEAANADAETEPDASDTPEQAEAKRHKRSGGWQRKVERQQREVERLERENRLLMERLMGTLPAAPANAAPAAEKTPEQKAQEWIDAQIAKKLAEKEAERAALEAQQALQKRTAEFKALHPDFDEVLMQADGVPVSGVVSQALLTSDQGPAIMYALASNPAELARISALPPLDAVREIGRLEARLASSTPAPKTQAPKVARKPAPAPIAPVTARGPSAVKDPSQMSYEEYSAWREAQRNKR